MLAERGSFMIEIIKNIGVVLATAIQLTTCFAIFIKPLRRRLVKWLRKVTDADTSSEIKDMLAEMKKTNEERDKKIDRLIRAETYRLRDRMTDMYAKYMSAGSIPQKRREELIKDYEIYKEMGGNSYIDIIYQEMLELPMSSNWV